MALVDKNIEDLPVHTRTEDIRGMSLQELHAKRKAEVNSDLNIRHINQPAVHVTSQRQKPTSSSRSTEPVLEKIDVGFLGRRKHRKHETNTLYYPTNINLFPNVFLKMEFYDRKNPYDSKTSTINPSYPPHTEIYLPFPDTEGFLQRDLYLDYELEEIGITGEFAKGNSADILDSFKRTLSDAEFQNINKEVKGLFTKDGFSGAVNTFLERMLLDTSAASAARRAVTQATGYGFAPHKTLMFQGVRQARNKSLEFRFTAKNYDDAKMLEKISREIHKASLPELKKEQFQNEITGFFTGEVTRRDSDEPSLGFYSQYNEETKSDVFVDSVKNTQYFSSTFDLPMRLHMKVMKKSNYSQDKKEATEAVELYRFPRGFMISDVTLEQGSGGNSNMNDLSMIQHVHEDGTIEYFNQKFDILINMSEETILTSEDMIDYSKEM